MKGALWVSWSEKWKSPLLAMKTIEGLDFDRAEIMAKQARLQRRLIAAVPVGNA